MSTHHYSVRLSESQISGDLSELKDLNVFIKEDRVLDDEIRQAFPLNNYGDVKDKLLIFGVEELIKLFDVVDREKLDIPEKLSNIKYIGLSDDNQIILAFKDTEGSDEITSKGIYDFTYSFLNEVFQMGKFSKFCIKNGYKDLLRENIEQLLVKLGEVEKQYRLLKIDEEYYLRGITSLRYRNYDNHLALYLSLLSIHSYAKENKKTFTIETAHMTDSEIRVFFKQLDPVEIPDFGDLYLGVYVSNNEIGDKAFSLELRYSIVDANGNHFSGLNKLEDAIFYLNHSTGVKNSKEKIKNIFTLKERQDLLVNYITNIKNADKLSESVIYLLFKKLASSTQKLSSTTRSNANKLKNDKVINNTMNLIEIFDKVGQITKDLDEQIVLERIYNEVISELQSSSEN
ncbi:hypothetical protein [Bacillus pseudomycoides]|uniref:hypothetical protein n=1 Tax=Bacillus pseudomycoides TaxID=64104 RepID=UPI000BF5679C|nr:hypothetical protein [Bacillus pseudomycoides]PGF09646.1 hypothetical protein COM59_07110 [Bacillus pseudomycoides]PHA95717.1 hypothetical protein COE78_08795 [Bacillus pseudomycoides]